MLNKAPHLLDSVERIIPVFSPSLNAIGDFLNGLPTPQCFPPKRVLLREGERTEYVRFIRSGVLKLTIVSDRGQESVLGLRSEGFWAGASSALLDLESLHTVTTLTECEVSSVPVTDFMSRLMQNHRLLRHFMAAQSRELLVVQQHGKLQSTSATKRLNYLQSEMAQSCWKTIDPFTLIKRGEIASLLAITPEHLSRLMHA